MGDPFSVAASALGVVSVGIQMCQGLVWYIDCMVDRNEDLAQASASTSRLLDILELLNQKISNKTFSEAEVKIINDNVAACGAWIDNLKKKLDKYGVPTESSLLAKARLQARRKIYPFKKSALEKICSNISHAQNSLSLALEILHL
jgi:hypothetical protein